MNDERRPPAPAPRLTAEKGRKEKIAALKVHNRRQSAKHVQQINERARRFAKLSDTALNEEIIKAEELLLRDAHKVDYLELKKAKADWDALLEERVIRADERKRIAAQVEMREREEQTPEEFSPSKGLPYHELQQRIEKLRAQRDQYQREAQLDASLRHSVKMLNDLLTEAEAEKQRRMQGFKQPRGSLDRNDHKASKAFNRSAGQAIEE